MSQNEPRLLLDIETYLAGSCQYLSPCFEITLGKEQQQSMHPARSRFNYLTSSPVLSTTAQKSSWRSGGDVGRVDLELDNKYPYPAAYFFLAKEMSFEFKSEGFAAPLFPNLPVKHSVTNFRMPALEWRASQSKKENQSCLNVGMKSGREGRMWW